METSWSGTFRYRAATVHRPRTVGELQQLVAGARRVRAVGTRHSFTDIGDSDALVSVAELPGRPELDSRAGTVRVPAATRYGELAAFLHRHGWALANLASLPHISVAGSVVTGTHGSGNDNQTLAAAVRSVSFVAGDGELISLTDSAPEFSGAVVQLGALGVITELVLAVEPTFDVRQDVYERLGWPTLIERFDDVLSSGYSVSVMTDFAGAAVDMVWVKTRLVPGEAGSAPDRLFDAVAATQPLHPTRGNDPAHCTPQLGAPGPWCDRLAHFRSEYTPSSGSEIQSEYLVDRVHAPAVIEALRGLGAVIAPLVYSAEIRSVAADELWLSPAYRRDCAAVHFTWRPDARAVNAALARIEPALAPYAPRPHWAKVFRTPARPWPELYPRLADFQKLAARYDPRGAFRNSFTDRTILPAESSPQPSCQSLSTKYGAETLTTRLGGLGGEK